MTSDEMAERLKQAIAEDDDNASDVVYDMALLSIDAARVAIKSMRRGLSRAQFIDLVSEGWDGAERTRRELERALKRAGEL